MKNINIEQYIEDYENGKITTIQIAKKENVARGTVNVKINTYYKSIR